MTHDYKSRLTTHPPARITHTYPQRLTTERYHDRMCDVAASRPRCGWAIDHEQGAMGSDLRAQKGETSMVKDPVCGMMIDEKTAAGKSDVQGET